MEGLLAQGGEWRIRVLGVRLGWLVYYRVGVVGGGGELK